MRRAPELAGSVPAGYSGAMGSDDKAAVLAGRYLDLWLANMAAWAETAPHMLATLPDPAAVAAEPPPGGSPGGSPEDSKDSSDVDAGRR